MNGSGPVTDVPGTTRDAISRALSRVPIWLAPMLLIVGFALFTPGVWVARRDLTLDGSLLYLVRYVQIAVYFVVAYLFRDHLPSVRALVAAAVATLGVHFAIELGMAALAASGSPSVVAGFAGTFSSVCSGIGNALVLLVCAHLFSTYEPRRGSCASRPRRCAPICATSTKRRAPPTSSR